MSTVRGESNLARVMVKQVVGIVCVCVSVCVSCARAFTVHVCTHMYGDVCSQARLCCLLPSLVSLLVPSLSFFVLFPCSFFHCLLNGTAYRFKIMEKSA